MSVKTEKDRLILKRILVCVKHIQGLNQIVDYRQLNKIYMTILRDYFQLSAKI